MKIAEAAVFWKLAIAGDPLAGAILLSCSYMFFVPTKLPLTAAQLSEETVHSFADAAQVQAALSVCLPGITWTANSNNALTYGELMEGDAQYEFSVRIFEEPENAGPPKLMVSMRCSGRIDSAPFVQRLVDASGWIAFDDRAYLFQPHLPPAPGGME